MNHDWPCAAAGATDPGLKRASNQDGFVVDEARGLFIVADGMGGHPRGDVASAELLALLTQKLGSASCGAEAGIDVRMTCVREALIESNRILYERNHAAGLADGRGMGTVVAGLWAGRHGEPAVLFHVGDCRVYVWRGGQLTRLTSDHSAYQQWIDQGSVGVPPSRNVLTRCIGPRPEVEPEVQTFRLQIGDRCLICSDGLTTMLRDEELAWLLAEAGAHPLSVACQRFINEANDRGGTDNITVVLVHMRA